MDKNLNHLILIMLSPEFEMLFDRENTIPTMLKQDFLDLRDEYCMDLVSSDGFVNNNQPDNITPSRPSKAAVPIAREAL